MIPKPVSEAWLVCALQEHPYQNCAGLENLSPQSLKRRLEQLLGRRPSRKELVQMVADRTIDVDRLKMPSFTAFRSRLEEVI